MRAWTILLALTVAPFAAAAQDSDGPELAYGGTGRAAHYFYTQVFADCEKLTHSFGRNTAWKGWHLPMARISTGEVHADGAAALVRFDCLDGSTCIAHSQPAARQDDVARHDIPFETVEGAERFLLRLAGLRTACAATLFQTETRS